MNTFSNIKAFHGYYLLFLRIIINSKSMKKAFSAIILTIAASLFLADAHAQEGPYEQISVDHHRISLDIRDFENGIIRGHAELDVRSKQKKARSLSLNLLNMEVDSVWAGGRLLPASSYSYDGAVLEIDLPKTLKKRKARTIGVAYHGKPVSRRFGGFSWFPEQKMAHNMGVSINDVPHSYAKSWYPAVDDFRAKSTYEMSYRVPEGLMAVGNGTLTGHSVLADGSGVWTWTLAQEVPDYLINVAVGDYKLVHFDHRSINGKTIPVDIYVTPDEYEEAVEAFSVIPAVMHSVESHFGAYAFDRAGFVTVNTTGGAMEHVTNISMPRRPRATDSYRELAIHELIHSWFGNLVTCETPGDMWLNEGITSYVVEVVLEDLINEGLAKEEQLSKYQRDLDRAAMSIAKDNPRYHPLAGTPESDTYGTLVYKKGAWVTRKLRQMLGDELFFKGMHQYVKEFSFDNATTEEFKASMEKSTGVDLTSFFEENIYN